MTISVFGQTNTDVYGAGARVRMIGTDGKIRTIAGGGTYGFNGDNQPATSATLSAPQGIAVDSAGNIYVADGTRIRCISRLPSR